MRHHGNHGARRNNLRRRTNPGTANSTGPFGPQQREAVLMTEDWIESFKACLMEVTLKWRGEDTNIGRVKAFVQAVERETARVCSKPGVSDADKQQIRKLAYEAIDRAQKYDRVLAYSPAKGR